VSGDVVEMLRSRHDADAACPHTRIASSGWSGEPFNVGYAIDVLHPLALRSSIRTWRDEEPSFAYRQRSWHDQMPEDSP
jgi:hypothetical protein